MLILKKNCLLATIMLAMGFGCEKPESDFDVAQLNGKCFRGTLIAGQRCSSVVYAQVLGFGANNKSVYLGQEYSNVIRIENYGNFPDSVKGEKDFYFVVDTETKGCATYAPCQMIVLKSDTPPSNVTVSVCISHLSAVPCGSGNSGK